MEEKPRPSQVFLSSDGTTADFEEFWKADPIGAAQYATGLAKAAKEKFEGLEEMQQVLESEGPIEERKQRLLLLGAKAPTLFKFVQATEATLQQREETLGWSTR